MQGRPVEYEYGFDYTKMRRKNWTNTSEIPSELPRDTARNTVERGGIGSCNAQHSESDPDLQEANEPDPAEPARRGLVMCIDGKAERCHVRNG